MSVSISIVDTYKGTGYRALKERCFGVSTAWVPSRPGIMEAFAADAIAVKGQKIRAAALFDGKLVGYSFGWLMADCKFLLAASAVEETFRRRGIYGQMHAALAEEVGRRGGETMWSQHSSSNNAILIAKLRLGYKIVGTSQLLDGELNIYLAAEIYGLTKAQP